MSEETGEPISVEETYSSSDFDENASDDDDDELTLDEEEALDKTDIKNELDLLREESEMTVEELRKRYNVDEATSSAAAAATTATTADGAEPRCPSRSLLLAKFMNESGTMDDSVDDNDDDYEPTFHFSRKICVGEDYQIPSLPDTVAHELSAHDADSLWIPSEKCSNETISNYLKTCERLRYESQDNSGPRPVKPSPVVDMPPDDENALYALYTNDYNPEVAVKNAPFGWSTLRSVNGPRLTYTEPWREFTEDDCVLFEQGMKQYKKNFFQIQHELLTDRTVGELVRFYYTWKKTERYDMFVNQNQDVEGDPNATDFMGDIMDELLEGGSGAMLGGGEGEDDEGGEGDGESGHFEDEDEDEMDETTGEGEETENSDNTNGTAEGVKACHIENA